MVQNDYDVMGRLYHVISKREPFFQVLRHNILHSMAFARTLCAAKRTLKMDSRVQFGKVPVAHAFFARGLWWRKTLSWKGGKNTVYNATRIHKVSQHSKESNFGFFEDMVLVKYSKYQKNIIASSEDNVVYLEEARSRLRKNSARGR